MSEYLPGDRVLYRDGDRFAVARVDLVNGRYLTGFPFCTVRRTWSAGRRRIAASFVIGKLPPQEHAAWAQVASLLLNLSETVTRQ